jgi:hypothetical protein
LAEEDDGLAASVAEDGAQEQRARALLAEATEPAGGGDRFALALALRASMRESFDLMMRATRQRRTASAEPERRALNGVVDRALTRHADVSAGFLRIEATMSLEQRERLWRAVL